jgi:hypothetical protein
MMAPVIGGARRAGAKRWGAGVAAPAALAIAALIPRVRCFHPYADSWDPCEYVWAVDGGYLPHSPYILYLWAGRLASLALPADIALSLISLACGLAAVAMVTMMGRRQGGDPVAGLVAGAAFAIFPCAVWFSGIQEVYALAGALGLAACLIAGTRGPRAAVAGGALYGAALATHTGMVFIGPAFLLALVMNGRLAATSPAGRSPATPASVLRGRLLPAGAGALLFPLSAVVWVASVIQSPEPARGGLLSYLAGIAPLEGTPASGLASSMMRTLGGMLDQTVGIGPPALVLAGCVVLAAARAPRIVVFWTLYALPYLLYEAAIGWNVDPGVHMVFTGPPLAVLLGCGAASARRWLSSAGARRGASLAGWACVAAVVLALLPAASRSWALGGGITSRAAFLSTEPVATLLELRDGTPPQAVIVQPAAIDNVNLIPAYSRRRPIIHQEGRHLLFEGGAGSPLNLGSFTPVTRQILERLLLEGVPVLSLIPDPFPVTQAGLWWRPEGGHFVLERALAPGGGR